MKIHGRLAIHPRPALGFPGRGFLVIKKGPAFARRAFQFEHSRGLPRREGQRECLAVKDSESGVDRSAAQSETRHPIQPAIKARLIFGVEYPNLPIREHDGKGISVMPPAQSVH